MGKNPALFLVFTCFLQQVLPLDNNTSSSMATTLFHSAFEPQKNKANIENDQNSKENSISVRLAAASTNPNDIHFYAFSKTTDRKKGLQIPIGDTESLSKSGLVKGNSLLLIMRPFTPAPSRNATVGQANLYVDFHPSVNVIVADFNKLVTPETGLNLLTGITAYSNILKNIPIVGKKVAAFVEFILDSGYVQGIESVHILSSSLGAHCAGSVGYFLQKNTGKKIGRITGADPPGPGYNMLASQNKLSKSKARFVDVIHTTTDTLSTPQALGHVDFYANGGQSLAQKECLAVANGDLDILTRIECAHNKAADYFDRTIPGKPLRGCRCLPSNIPSMIPCPKPDLKKCTDFGSFGESGTLTSRGKFYVHIG